jgi:spermidine synthase
MHLSADAVQRQNVKSHTIIEIHPEIYSMALDWAKDKKNVKIILGDWEQVIPKLNFKYDGIMHDVFGLKTSDKFLKIIKPICQENCVVVFAFYKDDENINIYDTVNFTFTDEEYENLPKFPYHSDPFFTKDHFEIRYTTYNNGGFSKRKLNKKLY